jgi:hypothetical protein
MFDAKIVEDEGIVRRDFRSVRKHASLDELVDYARSQGYHVIETGNQYVVLCNRGALKIHC